MACDITAGRLEPCQDAQAGIKKVYFINNQKDLDSTATFDSDDQITAFASALTLFEYDVMAGNQDTFDEQGVSDANNGTSSYEVSGTVILRVQNVATRKQLQLLQAGRPQIITLDYAGNYKLYGLINGCKVAVQANGGAALNDLYGYTLTVTGREPSLANFVSSAIIDDTINTNVTAGA